MYSNDLGSLLELLTGRNGMLHLEPPEDVQTGEPWYASLLLAEGSVTTCDVRSGGDDRVLIRGAQAIAWLASVGPLSWELEEPVHASSRQFANPSTLHVSHARQPELLIPQRTVQVEQTAMVSWSRKQRQVFALVDSTRSVEKIAAMLSQSPEVVGEVLNELQSMGIIHLW